MGFNRNKRFEFKARGKMAHKGKENPKRSLQGCAIGWTGESGSMIQARPDSAG